MSFPGEGGVTKYSTLQGGCSDGSPLQIQVGSKPNWITSYTTGNYSISARAAPNTTGSSRSGSITILQFGTPIGVVSVSQPAGVFPVGQVSITSGPTQRCKGSGTSDYNASASNATSYSWSIAAGGSTINSSGTVDWDGGFWGTATISVTAHGANNSSTTATRSVTVNAVDRPGPIVPDTEICGYEVVTVTLSNLGDYTRYDLLNGNGGSIANVETEPDGSPHTVTWNITSGGDYSIRGTLRGSPQCSEEWGDFTITQLQDVGSPQVTGDNTLCKGVGSTDYDVIGGSPNNSYSWSLLNAGGATINNNGTVSWNGFYGNAKVRLAATPECGSSITIDYPVEIKAVDTPTMVAVDNKSVLCGSEDTVIFNIGPLGSNTLYELLDENDYVIDYSEGVQGDTWTVSSGGTYRIRGTLQDGSGCSEEWGEVTITQLEDLGSPVLSNPGSRCMGTGASPITVNGGSNGNTYTWSISNAGNSTINGSGSSATITWDSGFSGTATITAVATSECGTSTTLTRSITVDEPITWYQDTDGDDYPDPDGITELSCTEPSTGNWTSDPQPITDYCPNYPNNADGSNGCNPDCLESVTVTNQIIDFTSQGGEETVTYNLPMCGSGSGYNIEVPPNTYDWLEIVPTEDPNTFNIICDAGSEAKDILVNVTINGNSFYGSTGFGIRVRRGSSSNPGPDPDLCVADSIDNITFGAFSDSQEVTVSYSGDCIGTLVLRHPYDPNGIPDWLTVTPGLGTTFTLSVSENDSGGTQSTVVSPMMDDGNGNYTGMGVSFYVSQANCLTEWYIDTDGDNLGDVHGEPQIGCYAPTNTGYSWVANNDDLCPEVAGSVANQGCPSGEVPENYNTITNTGFDVNGTMKSSSKAYFDELGKPIQNQQWNILTNDTWVSETRYDQQGRPALQTLSSPVVSGSSFVFKDGFMKQADNTSDYTVDDFTGSNLENPNPVGNVTGTLGWYYSDANDREPYQDISGYPFVSSDYSILNPGSVLRNYGGNKVDTNQSGSLDENDGWIQSYNFGMRASQELSQSGAFGNTEYDDYKILKSISRDVHGVENVVFMDSDGKVLAAARSGIPGTESSPLTIDILEQGYVDIHVPNGIIGFTVSNLPSVTIHNLITEQEVMASPTTLANGFYRIVVDDLENYDPINNPISVTYTVNYYDYSLNEYDDVGRLTAAYQPLKDGNGDRLTTTYEYDVLGQLIKVNSPDEGISEFIYRPDGQIRFSQNSEQAKVNEVSYTEYDALGRPTESGVLESTDFTTLDEESALGSNRKEQLFTTYDAIPSTVDLTSILPAEYRNPSFLSGNVAITSNDYNTTYYSYDVYGRVKWVAQDITGLAVKTIDYEYNQVTGLVDYVYFQKDVANEELIHKYTYDDAYQLTKVETSVDGGATWDVHADYDYFETGGLKRTVLADGVQAVDYIYNFSGQLKAINHPDQASNGEFGDAHDLFGMVLDYHEDDYVRAVGNINAPNYGNDLYNGNIKGVRWNLGAQPQANGDQFLYAYQYDRNNWLTEADYALYNESNSSIGNQITDQNTYISGTVNIVEKTDFIVLGTGFHAQEGSEYTARIVSAAGVNEVGAGDYDVTGISYDVNGNIQTLRRNKQNADNGIAMDDLSYVYKTDKPNQLLRVEDAEGNVVGADDIDTQSGNNYVYNDLGQLIQNVSEGISYIYNASGLVTEVNKDSQPLVKFFYNDRNHRVKKESYSGGLLSNVTYYVRDVAGNVMAIYSDGGGMMHLAEQPVYGNGRIGVAYTASNNTKTYVYELTDHLGNVRAVFTKNGNDAQLESNMDYYPGGMAMPGRNIIGDYRYNYQGQEKDDETGKIAFELRLYDPRINRWLTTDPMGEFESPYLAMGNNWANLTDPTGGMTDDCCPNPIELEGFTGTQYTNAKIGSSWQWLTKNDLFSFTKMNFGAGLSDAQIHNMVGRRFEDAWNRYASLRLIANNYRPNDNPFFSETRGRNVVPDGLGDFTRSEYRLNKWGIPKVWEGTRDIRIRNGIWVEVKAKNGNIYSSTSSGQIAGHIDAMGRIPLVKKYGGQIILVTTSNVSISQSVLSSAAKVHSQLQVGHIKVQGRMQNGSLQLRYYMNPDVRDNSRYHNMGGYVDY